MLLVFATAFAQLTGTVVAAESREPLGLSVVSLRPKFGQRFTDAGGRFAFAPTPAGTYVLSVRQIGYAPLDTQLVTTGDSTHLQIALRRLAIELPPVTIAGSQCTNPGPPDSRDTAFSWSWSNTARSAVSRYPGPPDSRDTALRAVLDQLQAHARRLALPPRAYPVRQT